MDIHNIQRAKGLDHVSPGKNSKVDKGGAGDKAIFSGVDGIDISEEANEIRKVVSGDRSELVEFVKNSVPDIRVAKVEEVTIKLSDGVYDQPEVIAKLAEKLAAIL
ncbi:MAG: hypothetical protein ACUZ8H_08225 [Candidatus Anammoxibacter sp.]